MIGDKYLETIENDLNAWSFNYIHLCNTFVKMFSTLQITVFKREETEKHLFTCQRITRLNFVKRNTYHAYQVIESPFKCDNVLGISVYPDIHTIKRRAIVRQWIFKYY